MITRTTDQEADEIRAEVRAIEARLAALENTGAASQPTPPDNWSKNIADQIAENLQKHRADEGDVFRLATGYFISQSGKVGSTVTRASIVFHDSAPSDEDIARRGERMRSLMAHPAILRAFRHFFALRFVAKEMRATAVELAEATGEIEDTIAALLAPFVADRTLLLVGDGTGGETYEWEGNDITVTALLFADR